MNHCGVEIGTSVLTLSDHFHLRAPVCCVNSYDKAVRCSILPSPFQQEVPEDYHLSELRSRVHLQHCLFLLPPLPMHTNQFLMDEIHPWDRTLFSQSCAISCDLHSRRHFRLDGLDIRHPANLFCLEITDGWTYQALRRADSLSRILVSRKLILYPDLLR